MSDELPAGRACGPEAEPYADDGWADPRPAERALAGDRTDAIAMWQAVAEGDVDPVVRDWLREVARRIVAADQEKAPNARKAKIVEAVCLAGKLDKHRRLREELDVIRSFENLETGARATRAELEQYAISQRLLSDDADVRSIVDRELGKLPKTLDEP